MTVNDSADPVVTSDFWYDLFEGGYVKAADLLTDPAEVKLVKDAVKVIRQFKAALIEHDKLEYL